jgi:L,D-transpeptidase ErfK/SrfK
MPSIVRPALVALTGVFAAGCQLFPTQTGPDETASVQAPPVIVEHPTATHRFTFDPEHDTVVGRVQVTRTRASDTLPDIARRFNLGYEELVRANPGVDPWLPGEDTEIVLPTQFVLPDAPYTGVVINLAAMRLYYFPPRGEEDPLQTVITHPIGIGKVGWETPVGTTKVKAKARDPWWFPPASVRREHAKNGDPLPAKVPPGVENPLGAHVLTLGWPSYLIHGTNKPYGVGMRVSHGCIRLYPEDIAELYPELPVGIEVRVVNEPFLYGWQDDALYVQVYPVLEDDEREHVDGAGILLNAAISNELFQKVKQHGAGLDLELVAGLVDARQGIAVPVTRRGLTLDRYFSMAPRVRNVLPEGSNWNGDERLLANAREWEAMRAEEADGAVRSP